MYLKNCAEVKPGSKGIRAFTLAEVIMAVAIVAIVFGTTLVAYTQSGRRAQWSGYSLAAQALAIQQIEEARSAQWNVVTGIDEITNLNLNAYSYVNGVLSGYSWTNLDLPYAGTNYVRATNYITISQLTVSSNPLVQLKMAQVKTVWPFSWGTTTKMFTNVIVTYCSPDN